MENSTKSTRIINETFPKVQRPKSRLIPAWYSKAIKSKSLPLLCRRRKTILHCRQNNISHLVVFASARCPAQAASAISAERLEAAWRNNSLLLTSSACTVYAMVQNYFSEHGRTWYVCRESTSCGLSSSWNICTNNISHNCRLRLVKNSFPPCSYQSMSIYPESSNSGKFC